MIRIAPVRVMTVKRNVYHGGEKGARNTFVHNVKRVSISNI